METVTKIITTAFTHSSERVIVSFYMDTGNLLDTVSKRYLTVTHQRLLRNEESLVEI